MNKHTELKNQIIEIMGQYASLVDDNSTYFVKDEIQEEWANKVLDTISKAMPSKKSPKYADMSDWSPAKGIESYNEGIDEIQAILKGKNE